MAREKRRLTSKERGFVDHYARHGNGKEAAMAAFDVANANSAKVIASRLMDKPMVAAAVEEKRKSLRQALIDANITEDTIADKVGELLEAADEDGNLDYNAIDKGLKHALTIFGVVAPEDQPRTVNVYNFMFSEEGREKVRRVEAEIKAALTSRPINAKKDLEGDKEPGPQGDSGQEGVHDDGAGARAG